MASINASTSGAGGVITTADNTGILNIQTAGTTAVTVDASQNVGIGTTSPGAKLDVSVSGAALIQNLQGGSGVYTRLGTTTSSFYIVQNGTTDTFLYNQEAVALRFGTSATERMRITSAGLLQFDSGYGSVATAYGCRAWVSFNGTGTVAIRGSGNVSSITDLAVGRYQMNFTTSMPDANYAAISSNNNEVSGAYDPLVGSVKVFSNDSAGTALDVSVISCAVVR